MNVHVYLEDALGQQLTQYAKTLGKSRNLLIREAVKEWLQHHRAKAWPKSICKFKGVPDMAAFESYRNDLLPPKEDPLA